jgi:hypothetical protein
MMDSEQQMAYWLTLQKQCFNPQLAEHQFVELRAALHDALHELQDTRHKIARLAREAGVIAGDLTAAIARVGDTTTMVTNTGTEENDHAR